MRDFYQNLTSPSYERYFIPTSSGGRITYGIRIYRATDGKDGWHIKKSSYYTSDLKAAKEGQNDWMKYLGKAELDAEIAKLKDKLQKESGLVKETREWLIESQKMHKRCADNAVKIIRHHKYKRCLAMAKWCKAKYDEEDASVNDGLSWYFISPEMKYWERWEKRWRELAEKFKPNNSTAQ